MYQINVKNGWSYFELCYNSLDFAADRGDFPSFWVDRQVSEKQDINEIINMMTYISAILRPCDLKFGMYEV
jgi:hypothetical protein